MPRRNAKNGDSSATTTPLQTPTANTDTASTALTQEPVTYCPPALVAVCRTMSRAVITAVSVIHKMRLFATECMGIVSFSAWFGQFSRAGAGGICHASWSVWSRWWARSPQGFSR